MSIEPHRRAGRIVAVAGGKGGVGKSVVSLNLAVMLGRLGHKTTIIDGDLGAPNLHTMMGITRPGPGLGAFLDQEVPALADVALDTGHPNLRVIPGSSRIGAANINAAQTLRLVGALADLSADVVVIDVGAGTAFNTIDLVAAADLKILVMTPQLTSLQNAYAFLKACVQRRLRRVPDDGAGRRMLDEQLGGASASGTVEHAVSEVRVSHPELAEAMVDILDRFGVLLVGNMLTQDHDHATLGRMSVMIADYLMIQAPLVASLRMADEVRRSVDARTPIAISDRDRATVAELRRLARVVMDADVARLRTATRAGARDRPLPSGVSRAQHAHTD